MANRKKTVIQPGGAVRITERHIDGRTRSVTGSAATDIYYEYGVTEQGKPWTKTLLARPNSPRYSLHYMDGLDRAFILEQPGFGSAVITQTSYFNNKGQLVRNRATGQVDQLMEYDELGNIFRTGQDVDGNGRLDLASEDRMTEHTRAYTLLEDNWWHSEKQMVYPESGSTNRVTVSENYQDMGGSGCGCQSSMTIHRDIRGNETRTLVDMTPENKKEVRITRAPHSSIDARQIFINGRLVEAFDHAGLRTVYHHDALGRLTGITHPRTGRAVTHYDARDFVDYTEDATGHRTTYVVMIKTNFLSANFQGC